MAEEREAKVRLDLEKGGDQEAFADTAKQAGTLEEILARLENAGVDVSGIRELSGDFDQLNQRVEEILAGLGSFGPEVTAAADRAGVALANLGTKAQQSLGAGQQAAVQARLAIDDYKAALDRARDAGANIAEEQIAELQQLETEYDAAVERLGRMRKAQEDVGKSVKQSSAEVGGQIPQIRDLGDVFDLVGGKAGAMALKLTAAFGAFTTGFQLGTKLRETLNQLTDGGFDAAVQKWAGYTRALEAWTGANQSAQEAADLLRNQLNILKNAGIDPAGLSAEEVAAKVDELGKEMQAESIEATNSAAAHREWTEQMGLSADALTRQADGLAANIAAFVSANQQLNASQFGEIFRQQIQKILDDSNRLGIEAPASIKKYAEEWGITSTAVSAEAEKMAAATQAALAKIDPALQAIIDKFGLMATAAIEASQKTAEALNTTVTELERLNQIQIDAALRTAEELQRIEDAKVEREKEAAEILAEAHEQAAARLAAAQEQINQALGTPPDTSGIEAIRTELESIPPAAQAAADALSAVLNGTQGFPFGAKPRFEPEGGFRTGNPLEPPQG
jgi:hypothetical protein